MIILKKLKTELKPAVVSIVLVGEGSLKGAGLNALPQGYQDAIKQLKLKPGQTEALHCLDGKQVYTTVYALIKDAPDYDALEELTCELISHVKASKAKKVDVLLPDAALLGLTESFYKQLALAGDSFTHYQGSGYLPLDGKKKDDKKEPFQPAFTVHLGEAYNLSQEKASLAQAELLAEGIATARRLVNEPANVMSPSRLAQEASQRAAATGFDITVYDEQQIQQMGLEAFYSVAKGSDSPPRFIVMHYRGKPQSKKLLALVGKGLTYDSGGYAIKPGAGMATMFTDMGGAGAVIGAMGVLARMKAKVNVVGIVAACENMVSGHAYRNGDIIGSLAGKFIEVVNTDAEGRLTLADAITYAATVEKADQIIDIATLTGAVGVALGNQITGVVSDNEEIYQALYQASSDSGDKIWRMPHFDHLAKHNKSDRADIKNSGGRPAGTATAALFCRAFAFGKPWGHLDIAGTAYQEGASAKAPAGATGVGAELLVRAALSLFAK